MSGSTIQVESSNMQNILIALVVIFAIVYAFLEFRKINTRFLELEEVIRKIQIMNKESSRNPVDVISRQVVEDGKPSQDKNRQGKPRQVVEQDNTIINSIINQVEDELHHPPMNGLFISVNTPLINEIDISDKEELNIIDDITVDDMAEDDMTVDDMTVDDMTVDDMTVDDIPINERIVEITEEDSISTNNKDIGYEEYTVRELKDKLVSINLPTSGNKSKLIERIISYENKM